jgi:hypothetical protein
MAQLVYEISLHTWCSVLAGRKTCLANIVGVGVAIGESVKDVAQLEAQSLAPRITSSKSSDNRTSHQHHSRILIRNPSMAALWSLRPAYSSNARVDGFARHICSSSTPCRSTTLGIWSTPHPFLAIGKCRIERLEERACSTQAFSHYLYIRIGRLIPPILTKTSIDKSMAKHYFCVTFMSLVSFSQCMFSYL